MGKSSVFVVAVLCAAIAELAAAQTCSCVRRAEQTCTALESLGDGLCSSSSFSCEKCECVADGEGSETCNVNSASALVFTDDEGMCALQTVTYAECPASTDAGWTVATQSANIMSCDSACAAAGGACNVDRMIALNNLGAVNTTAFAAAFEAAGMSCDSIDAVSGAFYAEPIYPMVFVLSGAPQICSYNLETSPTCAATRSNNTLNRRICCCGADASCPL